MAAWKQILGYYRNYWPVVVASVAAESAFETIDLLVPYVFGQIVNLLSDRPLDGLSQQVVDRVALWLPGLSGDRGGALAILLGVVFLVSVVRAPIQPWLGIWFHWAIPLRAKRDRNEQVLRQILGLPLEFYDENNPGRIAGRIARGLSNHTWSYPEIAGQLIPKLVRVLGIFLVILSIARPLAIGFLVSFLLILALSLRGLRRIMRKEALLDRHIENTESRTSEIVTNIKTVKAFGTESEELQRQTQRLDRELMVVLHRIHRGYVVLGTWQRTVVRICRFGVLALALVATLRGQVSPGHFITLVVVSDMAYAELDPISSLAESFARRYASMRRLHEFLTLPVGADAAQLAAEPAAEPNYRFTGKLEIANLSFAYQSGRPVLQDINLRIEPYETVALVGRSGSGKSTLIKLLLRYFEPTHGHIHIDGRDICQLDVRQYRRRLAIVHQEVDVFNGTVFENLRYGNQRASRAQVEAACRIARVDEFIHQLPAGYNTIVGERGVRLSGGQRQRLGIARALVVDPDVLIFDEATSSLDYESERAIQLAMKSLWGTRTTIVIAHRLSTVREADKIVVLDSGCIAEVGNHSELLAKGGIYHRLHSLQDAQDVWA
ncbi:MAG: ABC transporter ATP-binding protein [Cyanobacteria bacterium J06641_5]